MTKETRGRFAACSIVLAAFSFASSARADDAPAATPEIDALRARIDRLERAHAAEAPRPPPDAARITATPGKGFTVASVDGRFSANVWSRIQLRNTIVVAEGGKTTEEAQVRTFRLKASGHVLDEHLRYNTQLAFGGNDFEKDSSSPVFDAWVESTHHRDLNVRVGQFFVPLDRARTIREFALQMVDRPEVVRELSLDRDVGVMLSSRDLGGTKVLTYDLFGGTGDGKNRFGGQKARGLLVARAGVRPFGPFDDDVEGDLGREARPRLAIGVGGGKNWGTARQKSTFGNTFNGGHVSYTHAAIDLVFKFRGLSVLAEGLTRTASRNDLFGVVGGKTVTEHTRSGSGYLAQAGMMVHAKAEVTARWEQMFARSGTDQDLRTSVDARGKQVGGGVNVYLNGHALKLQADHLYAFGRDTAKATHTSRVQLDASF